MKKTVGRICIESIWEYKYYEKAEKQIEEYTRLGYMEIKV